MKSVLISIRPKWVEKIVSGEKTIEVRKSAPKQTSFKAYIYCTKDKPYLYRIDDDNNFELTNILRPKTYEYVKDYNEQNGKVIGEFICDKVDEYTFSHYEAEYRVTHVEQKAMCLNQPELIRYGVGKALYGLHITDLKVYDNPRDITEFNRPCSYAGLCFSCGRAKFTSKGDRVCEAIITRPPQSYMFVEER